MPIEAAEIEQVRQALVRYAGWDQVPDEVMVELCRGAELIEVKRKRSVFRRGEPGPGLFVVKTGEFKLSLISSEGREQILYLAEPGKLIGEGFLPRDVQCAASAFAMVDSEAWQFETEGVINLIGRSQPLAFALMRHMAFRDNRLIDLVLDLSLRSVERRLASFLARPLAQRLPLLARPRLRRRRVVGGIDRGCLRPVCRYRLDRCPDLHLGSGRVVRDGRATSTIVHPARYCAALCLS